MERTTAKGLCHGLIDDRGDSTMMQSTKLATKPFGHELRAEWLATKKKSHDKPGSARTARSFRDSRVLLHWPICAYTL